MNRGTDYDVGIVKSDYLSGDLTLKEFEHQVGKVLAGHRIHDHEWTDITAFGAPATELMCWKCGQKKAA